MKQDEWFSRWRDGRIAFHRLEVNELLLQFWPKLEIKPNATIFVPFCGKSLDMIWFLRQGYSVIGIELSPIACKAFFVENGLKVTEYQSESFRIFESGKIKIFCGDYFELQAGMIGDISAVFDRGSLVALPKEMREKYVRHMHRLASNAKHLLITLEYNQNEMSGPPFSVSEQEIQSLYDEPHYRAERLLHENVDIPERFRARGMRALTESVYMIQAQAKNLDK